jgi:hypothetical protein
VWTDITEKAFQLLKNVLITASVLAIPNFNKPFVVEIDASDHGIGVVLQQLSKKVIQLPLSARL